MSLREDEMRYFHINEDGTMVEIQQLDNDLVEHKGTGFTHPFGEQGCSVPSNQEWKFDPICDDNSHIPGYSITQAHWDRDIKFEERLLEHYSKMGDKRYTDHSMKAYLREYKDACNGIRDNNKYHLERIFKKAYDEVYRGGDLDKADSPAVSHDATVKTFLSAEGVLSAR